LQRSRYLTSIRRVVVKIGSRVLTDGAGRPDPAFFAAMGNQTAALLRKGVQVVLVSSGAIASGRSLLRETRRDLSIPEKQALAAVGQSHLMGMYQQALQPHGARTAQVLLTREDLTQRRRYLNVRNTFLKLLQMGTLPIVNENDTVAVEEIKFGDNDNLSALVAILVDADLLVLLTDAPGLCAWSEDRGYEPRPLPFIDRVTPAIRNLARGSSGPLGTGGMTTKLEAARIAAQAGMPAVIAHGRHADVLARILQGQQIGTFFAPLRERLPHRKHWIAYTLPRRGELVLDAGAVQAIVKKGKSLLPSGVVAVHGPFRGGVMVSCVDGSGRERARGVTHYSSKEIERIAGKKTSQIEQILGYRIQDEVIHRDELVVLKDEAENED